MIKTLITENFKGLKGTYTFDFENIMAMIGHNGIGKTTILDAIRFGLTGQEPDGDLINIECDSCSVTLVLEDDNAYTRWYHRSKPNKFYINDRKKGVTLKAFNEAIEVATKIPLSSLKTVINQECIAAMKPRELSEFILSYIEQKVTAKDIFENIPNSTFGMMQLLEQQLPIVPFTINEIDDAEMVYRDMRKKAKAEIDAVEAIISKLPEVEPEYTKMTLVAERKALDAKKIKAAQYQQMVDEHNRSEANAKRILDSITDMKNQIASLNATQPMPGAAAKLEDEYNDAVNSLNNARLVLSSMESAKANAEYMLQNLSSNFCPCSELITCTTDKSIAKAEMEAAIQSNEYGITVQEGEIVKLEAKVADAKAKLDASNENARNWTTRSMLESQLKRLEASKPVITPKPKELPAMNLVAEEEALALKEKTLKDYDEKIMYQEKLENLRITYSDLDRLVKALEPKGIIKEKIVSMFLAPFEELCNGKAKELKADLKFKFESADGVRILCDTGKGFIPYGLLSGGEQAYMLFIVMDMLNQLSGARILVLDELSVLDADTFDSLIKLLVNHKDEYDHILIGSVDHTDTMESIERYNVKVLNIENCKNSFEEVA